MLQGLAAMSRALTSEITMKTLCAWCKAEMVAGENRSDEPISHGICAACAQEILHLEREPLKSFLDRFHGPVLLVDADGRVITANQEGYAALRKAPEMADGNLGGDVINCTHARKPGGCGKTLHCKTCTIRLSVNDTLLTGQAHVKVPAYMDLHQITGETTVRFLITTEKVGDTVLLRIDEAKPDDKG